MGIRSALQVYKRLIKLIEIKQEEGKDIFILEFELNVPSRPKFKIKGKEKILIVVYSEVSIPKVYALREDFPLKLSHTNLSNQERPVDLCIYEESFHELKLQWSGIKFLTDIKYWLESTAVGKLHQDDQPLEPFFLSNNIIICGSTNQKNPDIIQLSDNIYKLHTDDSAQRDINVKNPERYLVMLLEPKKVLHGIINTSPSNLLELESSLANLGVDLADEIRLMIDSIFDGEQSQKRIKHSLALILQIGLKRNNNSDVESTKDYFFKIDKSLLDIGVKTDYISKAPYNDLYVKSNLQKSNLNLNSCVSVGVEMLKPIPDFTYDYAKQLNNIPCIEETTFSLIGVGALGSQFLNNMVRQGLGIWNIYDHDTLFPHNLTRHSLNRCGIGQNKAQCISDYINNFVFPNESIVKCYKENVLDSYEKVKKSLSKSDYIIDISTSFAVERMLATEYTKQIKFSAFLNPMGNELVLFSEDTTSSTPLDLIEFQFYKEILNREELYNHYDFEKSSSVRYARGCRDITSRICQSNLSIFSGILSKAIQKNIVSQKGSVEIWRLSKDFAVSKVGIELDEWVQKQYGGWSVNINQSLISKIIDFRKSKLPNETGGILLGGIDTHYKKIYLVDSILSPKDSVEQRTIYIRGIENVKEELKKIEKLTNNFIRYSGEWHSHPDGSSLEMSSDDAILFSELLEETIYRGVPTVMLIQGEKAFNLYVGNHEF